MTTLAKISKGAILRMGPAGGSLVAIAELLSVTPPNLSRGTLDVTTHDSSQAMEFIGEGVYDPGEISGQIHYIAGSTGDDAMIAAITDGVVRDFEVVLKATSGNEELAFAGIVTAYGPDQMEVNGKQTASFTAKVTGAITQGAAA